MTSRLMRTVRLQALQEVRSVLYAGVYLLSRVSSPPATSPATLTVLREAAG